MQFWCNFKVAVREWNIPDEWVQRIILYFKFLQEKLLQNVIQSSNEYNI